MCPKTPPSAANNMFSQPPCVATFPYKIFLTMIVEPLLLPTPTGLSQAPSSCDARTSSRSAAAAGHIIAWRMNGFAPQRSFSMVFCMMLHGPSCRLEWLLLFPTISPKYMHVMLISSTHGEPAGTTYARNGTDRLQQPIPHNPKQLCMMMHARFCRLVWLPLLMRPPRPPANVALSPPRGSPHPARPCRPSLLFLLSQLSTRILAIYMARCSSRWK
ncbi:unnamed protein product [Prorocentrum cordatum]|uniref:Uncharacterized protein n=1 Tax=Prorocentrum cordatum TaxID=2364126 RepID=A0ABN9QFX3_9DINO|nr:unnamed protein product [Polarella glacialis]